MCVCLHIYIYLYIYIHTSHLTPIDESSCRRRVTGFKTKMSPLSPRKGIRAPGPPPGRRPGGVLGWRLGLIPGGPPCSVSKSASDSAGVHQSS